jgi:hypothetical protein
VNREIGQASKNTFGYLQMLKTQIEGLFSLPKLRGECEHSTLAAK